MRSIISTALLVGLISSPCAADGGKACMELGRVLDARGAHFRDLRMAVDADIDEYQAFRLPGATECTVRMLSDSADDFLDASYACDWQYPAQSAPPVEGRDDLISSVTKCIAPDAISKRRETAINDNEFAPTHRIFLKDGWKITIRSRTHSNKKNGTVYYILGLRLEAGRT